LRLSAARSIELEVVETVCYETVPPSKKRVESLSSTERDVEARPIPWDLAARGSRAEPGRPRNRHRCAPSPGLNPHVLGLNPHVLGLNPHVLVVSEDYSTKEDGAS
jgi:hypothetical protein